MNSQFGFRLTGFLAWLLAFALPAFGQTVTTTATFHNIGVVVDLSTPTTQSVVRTFAKLTGASNSEYREAHPLSRLTSTRFAGSIFGLKSGTSYDLKLT